MIDVNATFVPIHPFPAPRPRFSTKTRTPYLPAAYKARRQQLVTHFTQHLRPCVRPVAVTILLHMHQVNGDVDNYAKAVLDALTLARIIPDDDVHHVYVLTVQVMPTTEPGDAGIFVALEEL